MENSRSDAAGWCYERAELHGIELWATGAALDHSTIPKELYCYDLYSVGKTVDIADILIAQNPVANANEGAVLSAEPLPFHGKDSISLKGIQQFDEEYVQSLEYIIEQTKQVELSQQASGLQIINM